MKIAVIGQSIFGAEVYKLLKQNGHEIVGVFTVPDKNGREDILGDKKGGFTIFWADAGLDTGPILLQKECSVEPNDTVNSIYRRFMMPEGIKAMGEAVELIVKGTAPKIPQPEEGATYDPYITAKPELAEINWDQPAEKLHNFIRGCDKVPGAWTRIDGEKVKFFGSALWGRPVVPTGAREVAIGGMKGPAHVHEDGMLLMGNDGKYVNVAQLQLENGQMLMASKFGAQFEEKMDLELTEEEQKIEESIKKIWKGILNLEAVEAATDFFQCGAGSMDVTRLGIIL